VPDQREQSFEPSSFIVQERVVVVVFIVIALFFCVGFCFALSAADRVEKRQFAFMRGCIEFHSVDRCSELWRFKREDLANPQSPEFSRDGN
jgi:hypothetical protein